jgi:hypothetical protein
MTIDVTGPQAAARVQFENSDFGNLRGVVGKITLAALAQTKVAAVVKVPPRCTLLGCHYSHAALGANTSLAIGTEVVETGTAVADAIKADAASTGAAAGYAAVAPIDTGEKGMYLTVTQGGVGTGTGLVTLTPVFIWNGI